MKFVKVPILLITFLLLMVSISSGEETWVTHTFSVQSSYNDVYMRTDTGETFLTSSYGYMGKNMINGWRFEHIPIPQGAIILNASLEIYSAEGVSESIHVRYTGEAAEQAEPFSLSGADLLSRPRSGASVDHIPGDWIPSGWNSSPDLAAVLQEIVNLDGWRSGNPLVLFAEDAGSDSVRGIRMSEAGADFGAVLNITYSSGSCEFDTDGDGITDISAPDWDRDGYCELPIGKTEYPGTLVIDRPVEIMGYPASRVETILKGDGLIMTGNGQIISDLTSPVVSSSYSGLKGTDLYVTARYLIKIENNARILLGGDGEGWWSGDIYFETIRPGNQIVVDGGAALYGRKIRILAYRAGKIRLDGESRLTGRSHLRFQTIDGGEIELSHTSVSTSSPDGACYITFSSKGNLYIGEDVSLMADIIEFYPVTGEIYGAEGATLYGKVYW